jgi:hypothetical protein
VAAEGVERAPQRAPAPKRDLDDELEAAKDKEPGPSRKGRREAAPMRTSGEEDPLFIER